jgi:hypothetical protein
MIAWALGGLGFLFLDDLANVAGASADLTVIGAVLIRSGLELKAQG